jgi:hypothetical protein
MKTVTKPWIAFKILAAGAIYPREAFPYAFKTRNIQLSGASAIAGRHEAKAGTTNERSQQAGARPGPHLSFARAHSDGKGEPLACLVRARGA